MVHACHAGPALQPPEAVKRARVRASVPGLCARLQAPQASPLNFYGFRVTNPSTHPTTTFLCVCALCLCFASPCFHAQTSLLVLALRAAHTPQANRAALPLLRATTPRCVPPRRAVCHRTRLCAPKPRCFPPCPTVCCHHSCGAQLCCVSVTAPVHPKPLPNAGMRGPCMGQSSRPFQGLHSSVAVDPAAALMPWWEVCWGRLSDLLARMLWIPAQCICKAQMCAECFPLAELGPPYVAALVAVCRA